MFSSTVVQFWWVIAVASGTAFGVLIIAALRWLAGHSCAFGHRKPACLIAVQFRHGCETHGYHNSPWRWATRALWECSFCGKRWEECLGDRYFWTVKDGRLVIDNTPDENKRTSPQEFDRKHGYA